MAWHIGKDTAITGIYKAFEYRWVAVDKIALAVEENKSASNRGLGIEGEAV
jgi:hypothetical protein